MNTTYFEKGTPKWSYNDIVAELEKFIPIFEKRPIKNNKGGMQFANMFYFFFILNSKKPSLVIESGVFKGQSTWLIEKTLPDCDILSIDIDLNQREYFSKKAKYSNTDFKFQDFSNIPSDTLVFFDDHINHMERIIEAKFFNIKNIIFEDNYSSGEGDFQTIKQIYNNYTFNHRPGFLSLLKTSFNFNKLIFNKFFQKNYYVKEDLDKISKRIRDGSKKINFKNLEKNISYYYEFPHLFSEKNINFEKEPILKEIPSNIKVNAEELEVNNFFTYLEIY